LHLGDEAINRLRLAAFLHTGLWLRLGAAHIATGGQTLVTQHPQGFDFRALACALAVFQYLEVAWASHAVFVDGALFDDFDSGAPQHQQFADVLDGGRAEFFGQGLEHEFTGGAVVVEDAYFDQAVGIEGHVHFFFYVVGQAIAAHHDDGVQVVGFGAVFFALGRCQLNLGHVGIIGAMTTQSKNTKPEKKVDNRAGKKADNKAGNKKINKAWLHDHINDPYVKLATKEGYRARAAYKLKEIDETLQLIKPGALVVDLGSTPGAWSQYVRRRMSPGGAAVGAMNGTIIALDLLPMEPIEGVTFIQGDFREAEAVAQLEAAMGGKQADVVVSDMAPNLSGISSADAARVEYLVELAIEFAQLHMKPQGALVAKVFHGSSYNAMVLAFKAAFEVVKPLKPKASRDRSSETFLVGMGLKKRG
jgi:23S rRNA (uridine2552-2'-O)-methyltransferase